MEGTKSIQHERIRRAIERWQAGVDREASFRLLVEAYYRPLRFYFAKRGFSAEDARDLTQEAFFGIYRGLPRFRREARFDTWLYQVAANTCRKALRDRHVQKRRLDIEAKSMTDLPDDVVPEDGRWSGRSAAPGALGGLLSEERSQRLRRAIATLPVRMRTCLALRIYQELSYQEIAVAMRLSVETVKAHLYQARRRLEKEMGERAVPGDGARQTAQAKRQAVKEKG